MPTKKRRSSLRMPFGANIGTTESKTHIKRRISFSDKNSVRVFSGEKEPKTWNNSYEISDNLNDNELSENVCPSSTKTSQSSLKVSHKNKENVVAENLQVKQQKNQTNTSTGNSSMLSTTKEYINVSYQNQNFNMYQIENSVDITLCESEKRLQIAGLKIGDQTNTNLCSFSLEEHEKEDRSIVFGEKTVDYMRELRNIACGFKEEQNGNNFKEQSEKDLHHRSTITKNGNFKDPVTIFMNDSLSISSNEEAANTITNADDRKHINHTTTVKTMPNNPLQYDKENINSYSVQIANETKNKSCQMEIEEFPTDSQSDKIETSPRSIENIASKPIEFSPDTSINGSKENIVHRDNAKYRRSIHFNQSIEFDIQSPSGKESARHDAITERKSRRTITFNQPIETSSFTSEPDVRRKTMNLIEDMLVSPIKLSQVSVPSKNMNLNEDMVVSPVRESQESVPCKNINLNEDMLVSPVTQSQESVLCKNLSLTENMLVSPVREPQESVLCKNLNLSGSIRKQPILIVRKVFTPLLNKTDNTFIRYRNKLEQDVPFDTAEDKAAVTCEVLAKKNTSLNFSLDSVQNMSLSSEPSSPLIPLEFKGYSLMQLNDDIECGKIKPFSNAPKTPVNNKKARSKNVQLDQSSTKHRKTLLFDNMDIPISPDGTTRNNILCSNTTLGVIGEEIKNSGKYRYSQDGDIMLDNTSFLARAKLSDESVSRNSAKKGVTQMDIVDIVNDSQEQAMCTLEEGVSNSSIKTKIRCNTEHDNLSFTFRNAKPIFTQTVTKIKYNNYSSLCDTMDISNVIENDHKNEDDDNKIDQRQSLSLQYNESRKSAVSQTMYFNNDVIGDNDLIVGEGLDKVKNRQSLVYDQKIIPDESIENVAQRERTLAIIEENFQIRDDETLHLNNEIIVKDEISIDEKSFHIEKSDKYHSNATDKEASIISNVSYFDTKTPPKENSVGNENASLEVLEPIENVRKDLLKRFIDISVEDIDKTRLSLVTLSYEDDLEHNDSEVLSPTNDALINEKVERTDQRLNVYCRKCKRCQDTLSNSSISNLSENFVLPESSPLPDLGLNRLRKLRERPTITDVNALWQRENLDRTIIISDEDSQNISKLAADSGDKSSAAVQFIQKYEKDMMSFETDLMGKEQCKASSVELPFVLRLDALLKTKLPNWIFDYQMQYRGILLFTHKKILTFGLWLIFEEADPIGHNINIKSVVPGNSHVPQKNWKPIDFVLEFQLKLNLPFHIQWLCKSSSEAGVFEMLEELDRICLDTVKMGNRLQLISLTNQATILRDGGKTYLRKFIRKVVNNSNGDFKSVEKIEIKVELLNLKKLSFKDIVSPQLYNFREDIHLLPTGLQFLQEFLPNPLSYLKNN